jgi:N-acetylglutamate synthase-like GNAT family acetyltransferase
MTAAASELTVTAEKVGRTWVAEAEGRPIGVLTLGPPGPLVEVDLLFVEPDAIGTGAGRALWAHAVTVARSEGAETLFVQSDPNAEEFYRRMGAVRTGESPSPSTGRSLPVLEFFIVER